MEYRQLGHSGLRVSALSLGTMTFGGAGGFANVGHVDVDEAARILDRCTDAGVNLIDTADVYSGGASEEIVGQVIKGRRDDLLLATKCRFPTEAGVNGAGSTRHHILRSLEGSLRRLGTDYVDLYQLHGWDGQTPLEETLSTLDEVVRSGRVRYVGCSNYSAWHVMKAMAVAKHGGFERFASHQNLLVPDRPRRRARSGAGGHRPGFGGTGVEPAGGGAAHGQIQEGQQACLGLAPRDRLGRTPGLRPGEGVRRHRRGGTGGRRP